MKRDYKIYESYCLFIINKFGKKSGFYRATEYIICFFISLFYEMIEEEYLFELDNSKLEINKDKIPTHASKLFIYEMVASKKKNYNMLKWIEIIWNLSNKKKMIIIDGVIDDLIENNTIFKKEVKSLFKTKVVLEVDKSILENIIQEIRAELLENSVMTNETIILVTLLNQSNLLNNFFSKHENDQIKKRMNEIKNSEVNKNIKKIIDNINAIVVSVIISTTV